MKIIRIITAVLFLALAAAAQTAAATPVPGLFSGLTLTLAQPPQPVAGVSVTVAGNPGSATYYYWIVSNDLIGSSAPAGPFVVPLAPNALSASDSVALSWSASPGALAYDVLRTTSPVAPTGACNCAVATAVAATNASDQSNSLGSYTVLQFDPSTLAWQLVNLPSAAGVSKLSLQVGGQQKWSIDSTGVQTYVGLNAQTIGGVVYANQFPGADIGAEVNAAIASVGCGTVVIPIGTYSFATTIVKPRCVILSGQTAGEGALGTILAFTPTSGAAITVGDSLSDLLYPSGGVENLTLSGPGAGTSTVGLWIGGDPAGVVLPSTYFAERQDIRGLRIVQFGTGVEWGSNAWLEQLQSVAIFSDGVGINEATGATNSAEQNNVIGSAIFNNVGSPVVAGPDLHFVDTSFDYNGAPLTASANFLDCHFEQTSGLFIAAPSATIIGGYAFLGATTGTDVALFQATAGSSGEWYIAGISVGANHPVNEALEWSEPANSKLFISDLRGNGGQQILADTNAPFALGIWVNSGLFGTWANPTKMGFPVDVGSIKARDSAQSGSWNLDLDDDGNASDTAPQKYLRVFGTAGNLQIVNSAFSSVIFTLSDLGVVTFAAPPAMPTTYTVGAATITQPSTAGTLALSSALPLSGTTGSIGGSALGAGACTTGTASVASSTTAMAVAVSPAADPGTGFAWEGWVSAAGTVTVRLCNVTTGSLTPTAETYNVRVIQ